MNQERKKIEYGIAAVIFFGLAILGIILLGTGNLLTFFSFWVGVYTAVKWHRLRDKPALKKP